MKYLLQNRDFIYSTCFIAVKTWLILHLATTKLLHERVVVSGSMLPSYSYPETIKVSYNYYKTHEIKRGDPIIFNQRDLSHSTFKRVIGIPGDIIECSNGCIYINGSLISHNMKPVRETTHTHLPKNNLWYATEYYDQRTVKVLHDLYTRNQNWCIEVPKDHYFMLGDHRRRSADARSSFGFVHRDFIVAKVIDESTPNNANEQLQ